MPARLTRPAFVLPTKPTITTTKSMEQLYAYGLFKYGREACGFSLILC